MDDDEELERILREELGSDWPQLPDQQDDETTPRWDDLEDDWR